MKDEQADLIPVRALNQVSYCPRLYYLEYVDAVMPVNEFVEDGQFQHRRINSPALANRTRKEGEVLRTRSVSLSSESLGLTAKLDVLEEADGMIRPVESKRSAAPKDQDGEPTYWINDAIQLCGQGMLIEEAFGATVSSGVLYYMGSKTRIDVPLDDSLRARTRAAIEQIKELSAAENPPEPLPAELRHRCFGCSLASVCLPEETLYAINGPAPEPLQEYSPATAHSTSVMLTRVVPLSDEKAVLYLQEPGSHVGRRAEHLVVTIDSVTLNRVPIASIRQVVIFGNVQVSTQALLSLAENEIPVVYLTGFGKFVAAFTPPPAKNAALRSRQYQAFGDPATTLSLSRSVVAAKIANQRTLLMRSLRSQPSGFPGDEDEDDEAPGRDGPSSVGWVQPPLSRCFLRCLDAISETGNFQKDCGFCFRGFLTLRRCFGSGPVPY